MGQALPFTFRTIFLPSPKTLHCMLWLAVCAIIPASEGLGPHGAEISTPQGVAVAGPPLASAPASAATVANVIPEPVPVPTSWIALPIVIDLK